uniref:Aquaporin-7-like n=1 Tax=Dermatophagoides pteronyssinus TaxID=6956 RepID=A0A6P6XPN6_DERPT|nr:aquaporin-7-like [Dermatophagoides pteronyssinus]
MHNIFKEFIAEVIGTAILMLLGISGCACTVLTKSPMNLACGFGYAFGVVIASVFAGPISGAHINPAITVAFTLIGKFQWRKVPIYLLAQYLGSFIGSTIAYSLYFEAMNTFDMENFFDKNLTLNNQQQPSMKMASIFITTPAEHLTLLPAMWDQIVSTGLLVYAILFIGDEMNTPKLLQTFTTGFIIFTFIIGFNFNCGAILNPARDLAPRILLAFFGYNGRVFAHLNYNFWWAVGIVGPHLGAIIGAISYYYSSKMRQSFIDDENMFQLNQVIQTKSITSNAASPDNIDHHNSSNHHRHQQQQHPSPLVTNLQMYQGKVNTEFQH